MHFSVVSLPIVLCLTFPCAIASSLFFPQLLLMLEGLVDERSRLNEALQAERQLYSSLVKFHAHPEK